MQNVKPECDEVQCPCSDGKPLFLQDLPSLEKVEGHIVSYANDEKVFQ